MIDNTFCVLTLKELLEQIKEEQSCINNSFYSDSGSLRYNDGMFDAYQTVIEKIEELLR